MARSGWSEFRRIWLDPAVYPLIGVVVTGVGIAAYQISRKSLLSLDVMWNRQVRASGGTHYFDASEEEIERNTNGLMSWCRDKSIRVFGHDTRIYDSKRVSTPQYIPRSLVTGMAAATGEEGDDVAEAEE
ncbi:hypothetical protein CDCA_CDCA19G4644 [Cyanidium caldarium]|uniref:NADH dehydrogenase [ubiquinone] 1 alpha subcomplex subunit 1 n=1 Tax=Cyanidium caldarium TaxID=2771 RepID=A0AAV9J2A8_CYACA|nr:hypothetical protein CDCA_CDCA19G4644 [Cyanidium caldarium]